MSISFRPLAENDMTLLYGWLNVPHMRAFYQKTPIPFEDVVQKYGPRARGETKMHTHIIQYERQDIGLIQCYRLSDYPDYADDIAVYDGVAIDIFIGDPSYLGRGLGGRLIRQYVFDVVFPLFPDLQRCYVAHEPKNIAALKASKAAGFKYVQNICENGRPFELLVMERSAEVNLI